MSDVKPLNRIGIPNERLADLLGDGERKGELERVAESIEDMFNTSVNINAFLPEYADREITSRSTALSHARAMGDYEGPESLIGGRVEIRTRTRFSNEQNPAGISVPYGVIEVGEVESVFSHEGERYLDGLKADMSPVRRLMREYAR